MNSYKNIDEIMYALKKTYPTHTKTTLNRMRDNPEAFKILISCLLSLRTQDKNTEIASNKLFAMADTPQEILKLSDEKLQQLIFSSGHYKRKAIILKYVSKVILEKYNGKVPNNKEELLSIKYIGPKTANIVLAFAFGELVLPIDVHCHRIPNRIGWVNTKTPEKTEKMLEKVLPKKYWMEVNSIFVQFGQEICITLSPKCSLCPINSYCEKVDVKKYR